MKTKLCGLIAGLVMCVQPGPLWADTLTQYTVSASFTDGAEVIGSFTLDTTTFFNVSNVNIQLTGGNLFPATDFVTFVDAASGYGSGPPEYDLYLVFTDALSDLDMQIEVRSSQPISTSLPTPLYLPSSFITPDFRSVDLAVSGEITPVNATPLPTALPLFATGLGALGLLGWRRKRKNTAAIAA